MNKGSHDCRTKLSKPRYLCGDTPMPAWVRELWGFLSSALILHMSPRPDWILFEGRLLSLSISVTKGDMTNN